MLALVGKVKRNHDIQHFIMKTSVCVLLTVKRLFVTYGSHSHTELEIFTFICITEQ